MNFGVSKIEYDNNSNMIIDFSKLKMIFLFLFRIWQAICWRLFVLLWKAVFYVVKVMWLSSSNELIFFLYENVNIRGLYVDIFKIFFGKNYLLNYVRIDIWILFRPGIIYFRNFFFLDVSWNFSGILQLKKIQINTKSFIITCFVENLNVLIKKNA